MASWKKYFRIAPVDKPALRQQNGSEHSASSGTSSKTSSYLPEIYCGHPSRIQRYYQYDEMDRDSDITIALNIIADFCTQSEEHNDNPFEIFYYDEDANEAMAKIVRTVLTKWVKLNCFKSRLWTIFRNALKNGDCFFLCDPETGEWLWLDNFSVLMVKVGEDNKNPEEYVVKGLDYNKTAKFATTITDTSSYGNAMATSFTGRASGGGGGGQSGGGNFSLAGSHVDQRQMRNGMFQQSSLEAHAINAEHVVHLSLSNGLDINWPFGQSVLEPVFKTYKQKELLEDSIIIYRVQRAPERRVFYIDVGSMPPARAKAHITSIKNEIHQRRIPSRTGSGGSIMDSAYSPIAMMDDFFLAQTADGRGSKVETLPSGDNLGEIGDLDYFVRKLSRGFNIPTSYMSMSDETSNASWRDGKMGEAVIQEFRFNKYCMRLQNLLAPTFDASFKNYLRDCGANVDFDAFELRFNPPQNFTKYRQMELDSAQVNIYQQVEGNKKLAERFKMKRYLNLTTEEMLENERMWKEENATRMEKKMGGTVNDASGGAGGAGLGSVGIDTGGDFNFGDGIEDTDQAPGEPPMDAAGAAGDMGDMGAAPGNPAPVPGAAPPTQ